MSGGTSPEFEQRMQDVAAKYAHMLQPRRDTTGTPMKEFKLAEEPKPRQPTSQEQIAKVLAAHSVSTMRVGSHAGGEHMPDIGVYEQRCLTCGSIEDYQSAHQAAVLAPLFAEARAEALREAAGQFGDNQSIREGDVKEWLQTRATHIEGRALVARIHERKGQG